MLGSAFLCIGLLAFTIPLADPPSRLQKEMGQNPISRQLSSPSRSCKRHVSTGTASGQRTLVPLAI